MKNIGFRDRNARTALFDGIEEGGIRASSSYSSHEIDEQENDRAMDGLQDRVIMLKRVSLYFQYASIRLLQLAHFLSNKVTVIDFPLIFTSILNLASVLFEKVDVSHDY